MSLEGVSMAPGCEIERTTPLEILCFYLLSFFWTSPEFAVCQPSYPPGMVCPAIVSFAVSGGFGESLLQLFVPLAQALLFLEIVGEGPRSPIRSLIALSFVLSPL
jgi:hypothetical protein